MYVIILCIFAMVRSVTILAYISISTHIDALTLMKKDSIEKKRSLSTGNEFEIVL